MKTITFALAKGRLAEQTMALLAPLGIKTSVGFDETRKLVFETEDKSYRFFLAKPSDVPTFVDYGIADLGVVGEDTILEENRDIAELLDLGFGQCRMVVAGRKDIYEKTKGQVIRVATKYPHIASDYFNKTHRDATLIKLSGSVELGPVVGLSDVIVDIVESGKTLKDNGLVVLEEVCPLSARLVGNISSLKSKNEEIRFLIAALSQATQK